MTQVDRAYSILRKVYGNFQDKERITNEGITLNFVVTPGHKDPRWIVPLNYHWGANILSQWQPYGFSSKIKWHIICLLYKFGGITLLPSVNKIHLDVKGDINIPGQHKKLVPLIYVGTPGTQQKAVVTLVEIEQGTPVAILKLALEKEAHNSLLREAKILNFLSEHDVKNVPSLLACDKAKYRTWQSVLMGKLTSRHLTKSHVHWLLDLPRTELTTSFDEQSVMLNVMLDNERQFFSENQIKMIKNVLKEVKGQKQIPLVIVHGDFAPWNLKLSSNKELSVLDWEDAKIEGLPLWDLCHFHYIQAHLFNEKKQISNFLSSQLVKEYLRNLNLNHSDKIILTLLYILSMVLNKNTSDEYKDYLVNNIPMFI